MLGIGNLLGNISDLLVSACITLIALTGHEFAHGWVSKKLGDPTPEREGRLTLNPLAHLDLVGTILMILTGFGWAKPVGVDPRYYKNPKRGMALTALAGPVANLIMAFVAMLVYAVVFVLGYKADISQTMVETVGGFAYLFAWRNLCFMVFNIIPIPPLDGSKVLGMFLPNSTYYKMLQYERYSMLIILFLSLSGALNTIIGNGVRIAMGGILNLLNAGVNLIL